MTRAPVLVAALLLAATTARAEDHIDPPTDRLARARAAYDRGDFVHARDELLAAYQLDPRPALLFALGQVELNLGHYQQAIAYYERFMQTNPPPDQAALAEQALGAARLELQRPPPVPPRPLPPRPPPHREWDGVDATIASIGGVSVIASGLLLIESSRLADERGGSLATYAHRIDQAHLARDAGIACGGAGVLAISAALLRWRFHLVDTTISVDASPTSASISLERRL
ncbi:MAG: tetratricopeptide repeat protein [Acidobacteriota bacterium]